MAAPPRRDKPFEPPGPTTPPPYQGPFDAKPPKGHTYYTQQAVRTRETDRRDHRGRSVWEWDVTVYYTKVDDPLAPLQPVHHTIRSAHDLREKRIHRREYWKESRRRSGWTTWNKVMEDVVEEVPIEDRNRASTVTEENRLRATKRQQRAKDLRRQDEARRAAEEMRAAEEQHRELIEEHRRQYRSKVKFEKREEARERVAESEAQLRQVVGGKTVSFGGDDIEIAKLAETQCKNALDLATHATEPAHLMEALRVLERVQGVADVDSERTVVEQAADRQSGFLKNQLDVILRRPDDASLARHRQDASQLSRGLVFYQQLGGSDEELEERAVAKLRETAVKVKRLEAERKQEALHGREQLSDEQRGLKVGSRLSERPRPE